MPILVSLTDEMKSAMKARDAARLSAIRMLISAIKYAMVDNPGLDDDGILAVLSKEAKKRREAIEAYRSAGREEQAKGEEFELAIIESYLPKKLTEDEVRTKLAKINLSGKNMGEAMKLAMAELKGGAEGGVVSRIVKELLI